jgi:hypothetical protein
MGALDKLNWVAATKTVTNNPQQHRRNKLAAKLDEQIKLATARLGGESYTAKKLKRVVDKETGEVKSIETAKRVKEWWWYGDNGKLLLSVRYGAKLIELGKNKSAVEVTDIQGVVDAFTVIKQAVLNGELDAQIEAASGSLRSGFKK